MSKRTGSLSINSENIFPIIKKWLYSDHDIFARELISNGCDAITKAGQAGDDGRVRPIRTDIEKEIQVIVNPEEKTLTVHRYRSRYDARPRSRSTSHQIAFSGAHRFSGEIQGQSRRTIEIIGHFGLGFYSVFMVADEVHIDTLSYQKDAKPVHWECDGGTDIR